MKSLQIGFVLAYGRHSDGFYEDTLMGSLCALARDQGHSAAMVRVYYDGSDPQIDAQVGARLEGWLHEREIDVVVVQRLFDPTPISRFLKTKSPGVCVQVTMSDSVAPHAVVSHVLGVNTGSARGTRRATTPGEIAAAFESLLGALSKNGSPAEVPGIAWQTEAGLERGPVATRELAPRAFAPVVEMDVISVRPVPKSKRKVIFGNVGCAYSADPADNPHFEGVELGPPGALARLGCSFCALGGDYQKRPNQEVVNRLLEQAMYFCEHLPDVGEFVIYDQHPFRYLAALIEAAHASGMRPVRWLCPARSIEFGRGRARVEGVLDVARTAGHEVEVYLSGFESFDDSELLRYNKGTTVAEHLEAVSTMRSLSQAYRGTFYYADAKGHSLVLWNPWTTPEHLLSSLGVIRRHGLVELFEDIGHNRLRLYSDLPIYHAAARDGALLPAWQDGNQGTARLKGYNPEVPWRFLDDRTRVSFELSRHLRAVLGPETELSQLIAAAEYSVALEPAGDQQLPHLERLSQDLEVLQAAFGVLEAVRGEGAPRRGTNRTAHPFAFGEGACNNGCERCANHDQWSDSSGEAVSRALRELASRDASQPVVLAGREPTLRGDFLELVADARRLFPEGVALVTNGRRFAHREFATDACEAGLNAVSVRVFAPTEADADAISRVPESFRQAIRGIRNLQRVGLTALEIRAPLHRLNLGTLARYADLAKRMGVPGVRVELDLAATGIDSLAEAATAVDALAGRCAALEVALEASPLRAGVRYQGRVPDSRPSGAGVFQRALEAPGGPRWEPVRLLGTPRPQDGAIWPFDRELMGLLSERRTLIRRDGLAPGELAEHAAWLSESGLTTQIVGESVLLAARDPVVLEEAAAHEHELVSGASTWEPRTRWLGTALGYPSCCVEHFISLARGGQSNRSPLRLPPLTSGPYSPLSCVVNPLALISHVPCSLACAPTLVLAEAVLQQIEQTSPGFDALWRKVAHGVHAIDHTGRALVLESASPVKADHPFRVDHVWEILPASQVAERGWCREVTTMRSRELTIVGSCAISDAGGGWTAPLAVDHRGVSDDDV